MAKKVFVLDTNVILHDYNCIHSFQDNESIGDYGPTIILEHEIDDFTFYTLYGHLSKISLKGKSEGQIIEKGESFASLGDWDVNVNWPPHLHFQIMKDLKVCNYGEKEQRMQNSPNPNLLLKIPGID